MKNKKYIYVAFIKSNTSAGTIIRKITGWKYSHISISLDDNLEEFLAFSRLNYKSSFLAGYTKEYKSNYSQLKDKIASITYYKIPVNKKELDTIKEFIQKIEEDKEYIFNYPSMFTTTILHGFELYKSYNCITFVSKILSFISAVNLSKKYYKYDLNELEEDVKEYYYKEESFVITELKEPNHFYDEMPFIMRKKAEIKLFLECFHRLIFKKSSNRYSVTKDEIVKKNTINTFNNQSARYDKSFCGFNPRKNYIRIIEKLDLSDEKLLDVGCGTGEILNSLGKIYPNAGLYGIDISPQMIEVANKKEYAKKIKYVCGDAENIPYPDNKFDVLLTSESFHHYPNPTKALKEFGRVLKTNGKLILCDMYRPFGIRHIMNFMFKIMNTGDIKMYNKKEISYLLTSCGFRILNYQKYYSSYIIEAVNEKD